MATQSASAQRASAAVPQQTPVISAEPEGVAQSAERLLLWLIACSAGQPDAALAALGLPATELQRLRSEHAAELSGLQLMHAAALGLTRERVAQLLRARVSGLALTAATPAEMAAVARAVRSLPDWVWDGAAVDGDGPRLAEMPPGVQIQRCADGTVLALWGRPEQSAPDGASQSADGPATTGSRSASDPANGGFTSALLDTVFGKPLNRAGRRRAEALQRKAK
jgi:hypothetical protein